MAYCNACKKEYRNGKCCPICGGSLIESYPSFENQYSQESFIEQLKRVSQPKSQRKRITIILITALSLIVIASCVFMYYFFNLRLNHMESEAIDILAYYCNHYWNESSYEIEYASYGAWGRTFVDTEKHFCYTFCVLGDGSERFHNERWIQYDVEKQVYIRQEYQYDCNLDDLLDLNVKKLNRALQKATNPNLIQKSYWKANNDKESLLTADNTYIFGSYEQDNNLSNGKEEIEWIILDRDGTLLLIISKYALDYQDYDTRYSDITWENCDMRAWLNSSFFSDAFSEKEQKMIKDTLVIAEHNETYKEPFSYAGNNTQDKVFLLSISEARKYFENDSERKCAATQYAMSHGALQLEGNCWWWLRTYGYSPDRNAYVNDDGHINEYGSQVFGTYAVAVRPALWIDTSLRQNDISDVTNIDN